MADQGVPPRLTREGLTVLIEQVKENKLRELTCVIAGIEVRYTVCSSWPDGLDPAIYDERRNIYVSDDLFRRDRQLADLLAFHEQTEIGHKAAGRAHGYAHRRALLAELLAARQLYEQPAQLRGFVRWRLEGYPAWKVQNKQDIEDSLCDLLLKPRPLRGEILKVIAQSRL